MKIVQIRWFHLRSYECLCTDKFDTCLEACARRQCNITQLYSMYHYHALTEMAQSKRNKMNHIFIHAIKYCDKQHTHRNNAQSMSPID